MEFLVRLTTGDWESLTVDEWSTMVLDGQPVRTTIITNISGYLINVLVQPRTGTLVFKGSGNIQLVSGASLEVESDRLDLGQIQNFRTKNIVKERRGARVLLIEE